MSIARFRKKPVNLLQLKAPRVSRKQRRNSKSSVFGQHENIVLIGGTGTRKTSTVLNIIDDILRNYDWEIYEEDAETPQGGIIARVGITSPPDTYVGGAPLPYLGYGTSGETPLPKKEFKRKPVKFIIISSTLDDDKVMGEIRNLIDDNGADIMGFLGIKTPNPENQMKFINNLRGIIENIRKVNLKSKENNIIPDDIYIIIDDSSLETKSDPYYEQLLKIQKNLGIKNTLTAVHDVRDINPRSKASVHHFLLYPGISDERLEIIWKDTGSSIPWETFRSIYRDAASEIGNFLWYDVRNARYYHNFSDKYIIN